MIVSERFPPEITCFTSVLKRGFDASGFVGCWRYRYPLNIVPAGASCIPQHGTRPNLARPSHEHSWTAAPFRTACALFRRLRSCFIREGRAPAVVCIFFPVAGDPPPQQVSGTRLRSLSTVPRQLVTQSKRKQFNVNLVNAQWELKRTFVCFDGRVHTDDNVYPGFVCNLRSENGCVMKARAPVPERKQNISPIIEVTLVSGCIKF